MLRYKTIHLYKESQNRLKRLSYHSNIHHTRDGDTLTSFTLEPVAQEDARHNLNHCLTVARNHDADYVILHENRIQLLGRAIRYGALDALGSHDWLHEYREWTDSSWGPDVYNDSSGRGELLGMDIWRRCLTTKDTQGIYEVSTGKRIKNRRDIISRFWEYGFAAQRGNPLSVYKIRWSGNREELEHITELADRYWARKNTSDVAKKMVAAFRSINRYAAWPGSW